MKLPEIDWTEINSIVARAQELHGRGKMDRQVWLALASDFSAASHCRLEMPAALSRLCEPEWLQDLPQNPSKRVA